MFPWPVPVHTLPEFCEASHGMPVTRKDEPRFKEIWDLSTHPCIYFRSNPSQSLPETWNMSVVQLPAPSGPSYQYSWSAFKLPKERWQDGLQPIFSPHDSRMP